MALYYKGKETCDGLYHPFSFRFLKKRTTRKANIRKMLSKEPNNARGEE